jgi:monofunctional biosynthetic peptidoglycan transglycosylase
MTDFPLHQPFTPRAPGFRGARRPPTPTVVDPSTPWATPTPPSDAPAGHLPSPEPAPGTPTGTESGAPRPHRVRRRLLRWALRALIVALAAQIVVLLVLGSLRVINPPTTAFMLGNGGSVNVHQDVAINHISRYLLAATIVHEDHALGTRSGAVDWSAFQDRIGAYLAGQPDTSGSTIPQQLAKNLFLTPNQNAARKAVEFVLANEMTLVLPSARILELYLNDAQFGPHLYGVCAATWFYFGVAPDQLTSYQSAQLMGILPAPSTARRLPGGGLDTTSVLDEKGNNLIDGAANVWLPRELPNTDSWQAVVATVGITDTATDHSDTRGAPDGCSTMPGTVTDLIATGNP